MHVCVAYEPQSIRKCDRELDRAVVLTLVAAVVPVRRPLSCCRSVLRFCTGANGFNRDIKPMFFNGFFLILRRG